MSPTPQETFWSDQALAAGREAAKDPSTLPIVLTAADGKKRCSWCDCPDGPDSPHNQRDYRCAGCPATAETVVSLYTSPNRRYDYPACGRHFPEIVATAARFATAGRR